MVEEASNYPLAVGNHAARFSVVTASFALIAVQEDGRFVLAPKLRS